MTGGPVDYTDALRWLESRQRLLVCSHTKPDGDAIGSMRGLAGLLAALGKSVRVLSFDPWPSRYAHLIQDIETIGWDSAGPIAVSDFDGLVIVDTCALSQLEPIESVLRRPDLDALVVDHHATPDSIGAVRVLDSTASSACLLVAEMTEAAGQEPDAPAATALFAGMATDTGWFRFSSVDARTLQAAGRLIDHGARPNEMYETLYLGDPAARLRLLGEMLATTRFFDGDRIAAASLNLAAFRRAGATADMTEDLINELNRVGAVVVAALFVEQEKGPIRVSLRSKRLVDVAELAGRFGGGGHQRAAGVRIEGELEEVKRTVIEEIRRVLAETT